MIGADQIKAEMRDWPDSQVIAVSNLMDFELARRAAETRDYYFTFGYEHTHPLTGEQLARCYIVISGTMESARGKMLSVFGKRWSRMYSTAEEAGVEKYGLTRVPWVEP